LFPGFFRKLDCLFLTRKSFEKVYFFDIFLNLISNSLLFDLFFLLLVSTKTLKFLLLALNHDFHIFDNVLPWSVIVELFIPNQEILSFIIILIN